MLRPGPAARSFASRIQIRQSEALCRHRRQVSPSACTVYVNEEFRTPLVVRYTNVPRSRGRRSRIRDALGNRSPAMRG